MADFLDMHAHGVSSSAYRAIGAGVQAQFRGEVYRHVLAETVDLNDPIQQAPELLQTLGRQVTEAGLAVAQSDLTGTLLDVLA